MQSSIVPVSVFPGVANTLYLRSGGLGPPPSFYFTLQDVVPGTPASGTEGQPDYVPPTADVVTALKDGNVNMTDDQWNAWTDQPNDAYMLECAAKNLGLTLVP